MSLFDGKGLNPRPTNRREMINQMSDSVRTNFLDPMMGSIGMESEETTIMNIMKDANLSDPKSVADTFSKIMAINPEAAAEFKTQVIPLLEAQQAAVPAANRIKEGTTKDVPAGLNNKGQIKTIVYKNGSWQDMTDSEGNVLMKDQFAPDKELEFEKKIAYIQNLDENTYSAETKDRMIASILEGGSGTSIVFNGDDAYANELGKILAEEDALTVKTANSAFEQIKKTNDVLRLINKGTPNIGATSIIEQSFDRVGSAFGSRESEEAAADTQLLDALLGSDVFPLIKQLGIGARGLDTPAERKFLQRVMTGEISMEGAALEQLTRIRQKYSTRIINEYNRKVREKDENGVGYFDRYESQGRKLAEIVLPKMVRPIDRNFDVPDGEGGTVKKMYPILQEDKDEFLENGEANPDFGLRRWQYRPNGPYYNDRGADITDQFEDYEPMYVEKN